MAVRRRDEEVELPRIACLRCGTKNQGNFYSTKDKDHDYFKKIPYCKSCIQELFESYKKKNKDNLNLAFYYLCRKIDIPYLHNNYLGAIENINNKDSKLYGENNLIPSYMKGLAFAANNGWGTCFDDSEGESEITGLLTYDSITKVKHNRKTINSSGDSTDDYEVLEFDTDYLQNKWGMFSAEDLAYLETEYVEWCDKLGGAITEKSIEVIVKQICLQSLDIQNARLAGSDVSKKIKTLRDLLSDGGLVEKQNNAVVNLASVGQRIEEIEKMRPICSPDKDLTDVDNVKKIVIGFVGSTCRALGKENKYTKEFSKLYKPYEINIIEGIDEEDE